MDCNDQLLFGGIINQPVMTQSWDFVIQHANKCKRFLDLFRTLVTKNKSKAPVKKLRNDLQYTTTV